MPTTLCSPGSSNGPARAPQVGGARIVSPEAGRSLRRVPPDGVLRDTVTRRATHRAARARRAPWGAGSLAPQAEARFQEGVEYCGRFFMGQSEAELALHRLTTILEAENIPYAII